MNFKYIKLICSLQFNFWGGLAAGIGSIIGGIIGNRGNKSEGSASREYNERTLRNQYQWAVQDMQNAGLNPALAYQQGGAGSGTGQVLDQSQAGQGVADAVMRYAQLSQIEQGINSAKAQESNIRNQERIQSELLPHQIANIKANTQSAKATAEYGSPLKVMGNVFEKIKEPVVNSAKRNIEEIKKVQQKKIPTTKNKNLNRMFDLK